MHLVPRSVLSLSLCFALSNLGFPQTPIPSTFQAQAQTAVSSGKSFSKVNLTANAEWVAGSLHQSGTAQLTAGADGSTSVQLALGQASRTETQTKIDYSRTCSWVDVAGKSHVIHGPNCFVAIPWFAPSLFTRPTGTLPPLLSTTDGGTVSSQSEAHQVSYFLQLDGTSPSPTSPMASQSTVQVLYDSKTFLPVSLEYSIHPDNDDSKNIPVRVVFSNYQSVSGLMIPYHIERSVNHTLQLTLDVTNASVE